MRALIRVVVFILTTFAWTAGSAAIPASLSYQAYLTDDSGAVVDGSLSVSFSIYATDVGGVPLWNDTQDIAVDQGLISVELGNPTARLSRPPLMGRYSHVSGGRANKAWGNFTAVLGGNTNTAGDDTMTTEVSGNLYSVVTGGQFNVTKGQYSVVSGGSSRSVTGIHDWRAGSSFETN